MSTIKTLSSFGKLEQTKIAELIGLGELKMLAFPYKGHEQTGVVYKNEKKSYLVVLDNYQKLRKKIQPLFDDDYTLEENIDFDFEN